jgi:hypothetical protein
MMCSYLAYFKNIISTFLLLIFFSEISMQNSTKLGWDGHCSDRLALCPGLPLLLNIEISLNGQTSAFVIAAILNAAWIKGSDPATLVFIGQEGREQNML